MARVERESTEVMAAAGETPLSGARAWLAPEEMVARYSGPALLIGANGTLRCANAGGRIMMAASAARLRDHVIRTLIAYGPWTTRVEIDFTEEKRVFDLTLLPLAAEPEDGVLILGREATLEHNLTRARADSRARYRDLVNCSADFAWETDTEGHFTFISPGGALGHAAEDLVGGNYSRLSGAHVGAGDDSPFACRQPVGERELWLEGGDGEAACVRISALPVRDGAGAWRGARGVCRDVTLERTQRAALRRAEQRETLMRDVVDAIRTEVAPEAMFRAAAGSIANALGADGCWVLRGASVVVASHGDGALPDILGDIGAEPEAGTAFAIEADAAGSMALATYCEYRGERLGQLVVVRGAARGPWTEEEESFLTGVAAQLSIAMAQAGIQEKLHTLSTTDELTGLVNRRGFLQTLAARFRSDRPTAGALLYLDLDNFKPVNDTHGHARGDEVLVTLARLLEGAVRGGDVVARLGGDEFVVWLEGANEDGGLTKARRLLEAAGDLHRYSADDGRPLSLSIGVVVVDDLPGTESAVETLLGRADAGMYVAKRGGKNVVAPIGSDGTAKEVDRNVDESVPSRS